MGILPAVCGMSRLEAAATGSQDGCPTSVAFGRLQTPTVGPPGWGGKITCSLSAIGGHLLENAGIGRHLAVRKERSAIGAVYTSVGLVFTWSVDGLD
jgi:hypothetical protein